ncbi:hypothetical protein [Streptomyces sp. NPDC058847]|uniref:hypothetical protein n=1 Tax=Streptomyces sp. NPDC058847 TaxID=3346649 RepID=UPI00368E966F
MTSTTEHTIPAPPSAPPPIWFLAPDGFFALPLAERPEDRAERAEAFVRELYSRGNEANWNPAAPYFAGLAELLGNTGVSYAALGLFSTAEESLTSADDTTGHEPSEGAAQCAFTLAAVPTGQATTETDTVAQGLVAALSKDPHNEVRWLDLPCGPAVACITWRQYGISPEATADGEATDIVTAQIQVHVPFPTGPFTAVFTLLTAYIDHWPEFCHMLEAILQTVSFVDPVGESYPETS